MQYRIITTSPGAAVDAAEAAITAADPAALVDLDPQGGALRVSTCAGDDELVELLNGAGIAVTPLQVLRLPSECCGGCGG